MTLIEISNKDSFSSLFHDVSSDKTVFVDVGAYNGDTVTKALDINPNLRVIAIEPIRSLANDMLQKFQSNKNVTVVNKAVWSNRQYIQLYEYEGWSKGLSTLKPIMTKLRPIHQFTPNILNYEVQGDLLDNILSEYNIDTVDYIKIDTEGSEDDVLASFTKYRKGTRFHIEFHIVNLENILQRLLEMDADIEKITLSRDPNIKDHITGAIIGEFKEPKELKKLKGAIKSKKCEPILDKPIPNENNNSLKIIQGIDRQNWVIQHCELGKKILDIGSQDGHTFRNTPLDPFVTSIDLDTYYFPGFIQMNANNLKFEDKSFDIAVLGEILEHVENPIQVLKEANRVSKRLLITVPDEWNWDKSLFPFETIEEGMKRRNLSLEEIAKVSNPQAKELYTKDNHEHLFHNRYYTRETLRQDLEKAGITNYEMTLLQYGKPQWSFFVVSTIPIRKEEPTITIATGPIPEGNKITDAHSDIKKLRIGIISTPFFSVPPKVYGGLEQVVYDIACGLDELGHDITVFAPECSIPTKNGKVVITGKSINSVGIDWFKEEENRYHAYKDLITPETFDVVIDNTWFSFIYLTKINNSRLNVLHVHHSGYTWESPPPVKPNLISVSKWMKSYTESYFKQKGFDIKSEYVYNPVDTEKYKFDPNIKRTNRLLYLGRFSQFKGAHTAIDVAKKLNLPLDLLGGTFIDSQAYLDQLERMTKDNNYDIKLYRDVSNEFKIQKLQESKALLVPSRFNEPFGLICVEGMACGCPIVAYRDGAIPEVVIDKKTGFICDTIEEMVEAVKNIDKIDPSECRQRAEVFSRLNIAKEYEKLCYKSLRGKDW